VLCLIEVPTRQGSTVIGPKSQVESTMTPPLSLRQIVWSRFDCLEPLPQYSREDILYWEDYTAAFFRSNGMAYQPEDSNVQQCLQAQDRTPFVGMAEALLKRLTDCAVVDDVDFVVLAHWLPDLHLGSSVTNFAMHYLGLKSAFGFAISDRGLSAPLFALDCIDKYLRDDRKKALLMVMDQKHLLYRSRLRDSFKPDNNGCVMLLERRTAPGLTYLGYRRTALPCAGSLPDSCRSMLASLSLRREVTTIITADPQLESLAPAQVVMADARLVCAAPFAALSEAVAPNCDYLLVTCDKHCLCGVGFRSAET
jgi:hypothetical protein